MGVSETLINKEIIYSTKHITENILLGMKESSKDTIETQDKTDPIM